MHRQPTFRQPRCDRLHHLPRLLLTVAVNHTIIGIAGERALWMFTLHPDIERIMHEQIHQDRGNHTALRGAALPRQLFPFSGLKRCSQPPFQIQQYPALLDVGAHRLEQETMIDLIEGRLEVELYHPVVLPSSLYSDRNRLYRRPPPSL